MAGQRACTDAQVAAFVYPLYLGLPLRGPFRQDPSKDGGILADQSGPAAAGGRVRAVVRQVPHVIPNSGGDDYPVVAEGRSRVLLSNERQSCSET
jgi:hypothetical protein